MLSDGLEEVLTLKDQQAPSSFTFLLKAPEGTTASQQEDGSWVLVIPGHAPGSFWLKAPYAYDSGTKSVEPGQPHAQMSVTEVKNGFEDAEPGPVLAQGPLAQVPGLPGPDHHPAGHPGHHFHR